MTKPVLLTIDDDASVLAAVARDLRTRYELTDPPVGLDNTLTMLGHKIAKMSLRLVRDYQSDRPSIVGNAGELNQVWTNLIDNAIDAMADARAPHRGEGTGLGLDIALRIVQTHGGRIDVHTKPGRTEMQVHLPVAGPPEPKETG